MERGGDARLARGRAFLILYLIEDFLFLLQHFSRTVRTRNVLLTSPRPY